MCEQELFTSAGARHIEQMPLLCGHHLSIYFINTFVKGDGKLLRMEGGVGLEFLLTTRGWYLGLEPLAVDFRYWVYSSTQSRTGFAQVFPLRVAVGHEF